MTGSVFSALRENYSDVTIRALVRSESAFQALENLNVTPVKGTFLDHDLITDLSSQSDIVINAADSDDVGLNTAILKGFKQRKDQGRGIGSLIHTSGTAIFIDSNKEGKYDPDGKVWTVSNLLIFFSILVTLCIILSYYRIRKKTLGILYLPCCMDKLTSR